MLKSFYKNTFIFLNVIIIYLLIYLFIICIKKYLKVYGINSIRIKSHIKKMRLSKMGVCHFENFYYINLYFVVVHFGKHGVL